MLIANGVDSYDIGPPTGPGIALLVGPTGAVAGPFPLSPCPSMATSLAVSRQRRGFTLIELLIVVIIIGILAAIAIPKFQHSKGKAFLASMRSDLRNLATAEESYFYEHSIYTPDTTMLNFHTSNGVVLDVQSGDGGGWGAIATHPQAYPMRCALFLGTPSHALGPATQEGIVACDGF